MVSHRVLGDRTRAVELGRALRESPETLSGRRLSVVISTTVTPFQRHSTQSLRKCLEQQHKPTFTWGSFIALSAPFECARNKSSHVEKRLLKSLPVLWFPFRSYKVNLSPSTEVASITPLDVLLSLIK